MNIFVTGATGYIGSVVTERLLEAGHAITALVRSERELTRAPRGITPALGDLADAQGVAELASRSDAVVWVATSNREDIDAPAVSAILERLRGTGKTFLYTSGVWVHGNTRGVGNEDSPLEPAKSVRWRVPLERRVLATLGVRAVIVRPGIVYGRNGGIPALLAASVSTHGAARFIGTGENRWATVYLDDLADLYRRAVEGAQSGSVLIGVQGPSFRVRAIAAAAAEGAGAAGRTLSWPLEEARVELGAFADALVLDQEFHATRAERTLDWRPTGPTILDELRSGSYAKKVAAPAA